jgi:hypothetical protein
MEPPKRPWTREGDGYTLAELTVKIVEDEQGWVFSEHDFASPEDAESIARMRNGGAKQLAYGLTTEALRREAFLCLLVEMSARPESLACYVDGSENERRGLERRIAGGALATFMGIAQKMLPDIAREVLHMATQQAKGAKNPSIA